MCAAVNLTHGVMSDINIDALPDRVVLIYQLYTSEPSLDTLLPLAGGPVFVVLAGTVHAVKRVERPSRPGEIASWFYVGRSGHNIGLTYAGRLHHLRC